MAQGENRKQLQDRTEPESQPINEQQIGAEFARAFQELAKGEQTATNLENRLNDIESRIEQLLASAEESARQTSEMQSGSRVTGADNGNSKPK